MPHLRQSRLTVNPSPPKSPRYPATSQPKMQRFTFQNKPTICNSNLHSKLCAKPNTVHSHILIGFETFGGKLNASTARDIATLLILINITNTDLILTPEDLGTLLARHRNGAPRSPETSDEQRGINAWTALHGALFFCKTERGLIEPYPLVKRRPLPGQIHTRCAGMAERTQAQTTHAFRRHRPHWQQSISRHFKRWRYMAVHLWR